MQILKLKVVNNTRMQVRRQGEQIPTIIILLLQYNFSCTMFMLNNWFVFHFTIFAIFSILQSLLFLPFFIFTFFYFYQSLLKDGSIIQFVFTENVYGQALVFRLAVKF